MSHLWKETECPVMQNALRVLEYVSEKSELTFDRSLASRALVEATDGIPGSGFDAWCHRLVAAGTSLHVHLRSSDLEWRDALRVAQQRIPVVACWEGSTDRPDDELHWLVIDQVRSGRVLVRNINLDIAEWLPTREVQRRLADVATRARLHWIIGQPALPCDLKLDAPLRTHKPIRPLERLWGLMRVERKDVGALIVFSMVVGVLALATPIAVEGLVNTVAFGGYTQPIVILSIILLTFLGFAAAIRAMNTFIVEIIQRRVFVRVVEDMAYRLPRVEQSAIDKYHLPELVNRFFDVATVQKTVAKLLLDGIAIVLQTVLGMAVLAFYHPFLLGFDAALLICIGFIVFVLGRNAVNSAIVESARKYDVAAWLEELARHPTAFRLHDGPQFGLDRASKLASDYLQARRDHFRIVMRQILFALGLQAVAATVLLGLGGWLVMQGELTLGQLVAAELIVMNIVASFAKLGKHLEGFYDLLAGVDKLGKLFDLPMERVDRLCHMSGSQPGTLAFHDVSQSVGGRRLWEHVTFRVEPGERLAIVGPAGCGKSAMLDMIVGIRQATSGTIALDDIELREIRTSSLRRQIGLARDVDVFHGTIEENVHLNRQYVSTADVREALQRVGLTEALMQLPDGLKTKLQTNGAPLTKSQCRQLMIARAIVSHPRILLIDGILDELSDESVEAIWTGLAGASADWTLLVVTGRREIADRLSSTFDLGQNRLIKNSTGVGVAS